MPKTLGIWEWGCPKCGDAHITVTPGFSLVTSSSMLWSSSLGSYQFCCYFIKLFTLSRILVCLRHRQCYAQLTLFPGPTQKQVGEDPGNEAKAQLPAAVRELRPRQNEPRPEGAADRPKGAVGNWKLSLLHECAILGFLGRNIIQLQVRLEENWMTKRSSIHA